MIPPRARRAVKHACARAGSRHPAFSLLSTLSLRSFLNSARYTGRKLKELGGITMLQTYQGSCHCGRFRFEVTVNIDHLRVCDCSICRKRGALNFRAPKDAVSFVTPLTELSLYRWGTRTAEDYFCPVCGILPLRRPRRRHESEAGGGAEAVPFHGWAVNIRCLDSFDLESVPKKAVFGSRLPLPSEQAS